MMGRWLLRGLLAVLIAALGTWLAMQTVWVDTEVDVPARGEAASDEFYAARQLLRELGATASRHMRLDTMPPAQAVLVLASVEWVPAAGRGEQLRLWVEQGGHLVLPGAVVAYERLQPWLPIVATDTTTAEAQTKPEPETSTRQKSKSRAESRAEPLDKAKSRSKPSAKAQPTPAAEPALRTGCRRLAARGADAGHSLPRGSRAVVCANVPDGERYASRDTALRPTWALEGAFGPELLRVRHGAGSVTVIGPWALLRNDRILKNDHALVMAQALQVRPGMEVWFFDGEARPPLLLWVWQQAWIAVLLALAALAAALWRAGVRFGPLQAAAPPQRRSMAEQVRGTAHFLERNGGAALLQAQRRALAEAAATHVLHHQALSPARRMQAIAQKTGLDAEALQQAWNAAGPGTPAQLALLETARRRLRDKARQQPSTDHSHHDQP